jgi:sorbitol-specific phosphotransferase system component IIBC
VKVSEEKKYRKIKVVKGKRGWGGPLIIEPKPGRDLIYSVTGGGIHPLAQKIADMTGGTPFDGFRSKAGFDELACAVIDCGGTARVGVYPMKKVMTIDIYNTSPSGPLMRFITEDLFVSGVNGDCLSYVDDE